MRLFSTLAAVLLAATASLAAQTGQSQCIKNFGCVTALYDSTAQNINYTMTMAPGFAGWFSIGDLNKMKGSNMMIAWVDNGKVVTSQRSATGEVQPTSSAVTAQAFRSITSTINDAGISVSWLSPVGSTPPSSSAPYIWASNSGNSPGPDANAKLNQHPDKQRGHFVMNLLADYSPDNASQSSPMSGSSIEPYGNTAPNRNLKDASVRVQLAHVIVMSVAFLGVFPAGALLARYGRTFTSKWFPVHHGIQLFGALLTIAGFALAVAWVAITNDTHFDSNHEKVGLALFIAVVVQVILGEVAHLIMVKKGIRTGYFHAILGIAIFAVSIWEIQEGFQLWKWDAPYAAIIFTYVWAGVIAVAYFAGFLLLPRERRQAKEREASKAKLSHDPYEESSLMNERNL